MTTSAEAPLLFSRCLRWALFLTVFSACIFSAQPYGQAQTFTVLHKFVGQSDGGTPLSGVVLGGQGTLYGTTSGGGPGSYDGVAFKMSLHNGSWLFSPIFEFTGDTNGSDPAGGLVIGPGGLYGLNTDGSGGTFGTVFNLIPALTVCKSALCYWNQSLLYIFAAEGENGAGPGGKITFDQAGNIYGTTQGGGLYEGGVAFKLTSSGNNWIPTTLYNFGLGSDGIAPNGSLVFDAAGNLYGTTSRGGGAGIGSVFELSPSNGGWTETILYDFPNGGDGYEPLGGLIIDAHGNLYGTTLRGGSGGGGTVFELSNSGGQWTYTVLYSFHGSTGPAQGSLTFDSAGNLWGTASGDGAYGLGMVFKLSFSNGSWTLTDLYDFTGGTDGKYPTASVALDAAGNVYGTAGEGGAFGCGGEGCGTVWEVTP